MSLIDTESAINTLIGLLSAARDGKLTNEEVATALDDLVDTGAFDAADDALFLGLVNGIDAITPDKYSFANLVNRDPVKMRARAVKARAEGRLEKAERIDARAARVEARQEG